MIWNMSIRFKDGMLFQNLHQMGSKIYSPVVIDENYIRNNSAHMEYHIEIDLENGNDSVISDEIHDDYILNSYELLPEGGCRFDFRRLSPEEIQLRKIQADVDFIMMMSGYDE